MKRFLVGGCAALLAMACADDPSVYLGGPPGPVTRLQLSAGNLSMTVGDQVRVGAAALDAVGNVTGDVPSFTACSGAPVSIAAATGEELFSAAATIQAAASTVGAGCVTVSAGGISDTIHVEVGPAGVVIVGSDTVVSGASSGYTVTGYDLAGGAVTGTAPYVWTSGNKARMTADIVSGVMSGRSPGAVAVQVRGPGGANSSRTVTVAPGVFAGTLSANAGSAGLVITATGGAGDDPFDATTTATYGGQAAFIEAVSGTVLRVALPATGAAGAQDLNFLNLGSTETAKKVTVTAGSAFDDQYGASTDLPVGSPGYVASSSPGNWVYFTHSGAGTGSASRGLWNGGAQQDHYFQFTTGATAGTVVATLQWNNFGPGAVGNCAVTLCSDFDLEICTIAGTSCSAWFSGANSIEQGTAKAVAANTTYTVMTSAWTTFSNIHNMRVRLVATGTTLQ